jgi:transketolase N-terminal domain/subunit
MEINNKELGMKLNPLINDIQKNSLKYNISDKLKTLNYSKFIDLNLFQSRKRKATINKIKKLDEKMKNIGYDSIEGILELNQDLII